VPAELVKEVLTIGLESSETPSTISCWQDFYRGGIDQLLHLIPCVEFKKKVVPLSITSLPQGMMMSMSLSPHAVKLQWATLDTGLNIKNSHLETNKSMSNNQIRIYPPFIIC